MWRKCFFLIFALFFAVSVRPRATLVLADTASCGSSCTPDDYNCKINDCQRKIDQAKDTEKTLSSQIDYLNNQISLTTSQINLTQQKIDQLADDIASVSGKINVVQDQLQHVSEVLVNRIVATYIQGRTDDPMLYLLTSTDFADLFRRMEYLQLVQKHDQSLLVQMATVKKNYNDQKDLFEVRKKEKEVLAAQLKAEQAKLIEQNRSKQLLLQATQNDEAIYQQLLDQAKAQLAAFQGFVTGQGGLTLIDADPNWPKDYFSQRDKRWGNVPIAGFYPSGARIYSIGEAGCLISSVAMVKTHRGDSTNPMAIGTNSPNFFDGFFLWSALTSMGFNTPMRTTDRSAIDNALRQRKWVIVGFSYSSNTSSSPFHFVVITSKNGGDYNLFDPWRGPNVSLNSNYGGNYITEIITY